MLPCLLCLMEILAFFGLWLQHYSLCLCHIQHFPSLCLFDPCKNTSYTGSGSALNDLDAQRLETTPHNEGRKGMIILTWLHLQKHSFWIRSRSEIPGVSTSTDPSGSHNSMQHRENLQGRAEKLSGQCQPQEVSAAHGLLLMTQTGLKMATPALYAIPPHCLCCLLTA